MKPLVSILMIVVAGGICAAHAGSVAVRSQGDTVIVNRANGQLTQVKIRTHEVQIGKSSDPRPTRIDSNCTYSRFPCSVVDSVEISVSGDSVFVPRSVFVDLADLNTAELLAGKEDEILRLSGGDGSEGYVVKIVFNANRVKRRTVASGTEPNQPLQTTIYNVVEESE